jgi:hypothetical protein
VPRIRSRDVENKSLEILLYGITSLSRCVVWPKIRPFSFVRTSGSTVANFENSSVCKCHPANARELSGSIQGEIADLLQRVRNTRTRLFNEFTEKIDELNEPITAALQVVQSKIDPTYRRLEEASVGYDRLVAHLERPFVPPTRTDIKPVKDEVPDICLRLFDFENRTGSHLNDRLKAKTFIDDMKANMSLIQRGKDALGNELASAMSLLETRRNLIWARNNSQLTVKTTQENARLTMENAQTNALLTMNNALWVALISFILVIVSNLAIQIWLRSYDERRKRKQRERDTESNRRHADEI